MKFTARIKDIGRTLAGSLTITLESQQMDAAAAKELSQADGLDVEIRKKRKKRSLDANAYYWKLASEVADALHVSKPYIHNYLLRKYGQIEIIDGQGVYMVIPDTESARKSVDEAQTYHLKPTSQVKEGKGSIMYRTYMMLKGSSEYDAKEMSHLIDGLVCECKEMGIETLLPEELERMMSEYEKRYRKRTDG
ncbi:hypothetical protein [uncultured Bacteroides sp.]|uniref:hypothetical protein n=1 Tax=uncultured Bacteroides sp. TaxID=162156 RepID=UPI0026035D30|nr:hypothetical protein [uncultured Bacteroides sp.]